MSNQFILAIHTANCIASAMKCAVENLRDSDNPDWTLVTHGANVLEIALDYLETETCTCTCKIIESSRGPFPKGRI